MYKVNFENVNNLTLVCKRNNMTLICTSTDYMFDDEKGILYLHDCISNPINRYGLS
ncbi:sugar nucleotide-binding protein [Ulvibacterium sp.]|uniref:sugar nucleotide-binding protein n=1 Tax=Ulvibacterium sp. TaxID=2665914 RepID=UPI003CC6668F